TTFENLTVQEQRAIFDKNDNGIMETFINARIIERSEEVWEDEEGCLSIPNLSQKVQRPWSIVVEYYNKDFEPKTKSFGGTTARMIQHEYDHTQGILYLHYLKPLTRKLMESKLKKIKRGQIEPAYPMKFI